MLIQKNVAKIAKLGALAALLTGSTLAYADSTIKITNNSKSPWCLRITEEASVPIMAQGRMDLGPVELSPQNHKLVYYIQPGDTCTLQFKEMKNLPLKQDIGLVDQTGTELGKLKLESQSAPLLARAESFPGTRANDNYITKISPRTLVSPRSLAPQVLSVEAPDSLIIHADCCK